MSYELEDIERCIKDGSLDSKDKATLEAFARVVPRTGGNPAYHQRVEQAQRRVQIALDRFTLGEQEQIAREANKLSRWAIVIAIAALSVAIVQTFWR